MENEFEAKVLEIDKDSVRQQLKDFGATLVFSERLFKRVTFDSPTLKEKKSWVRLRDEGDKLSLTLKQVGNSKDISSVKEIMFNVDDFDQATLFLQSVGLSKTNYQENLREEWRVGDVVFDIDTWPKIPTYMEIEAQSEDQVREWFEKLGFDYSKAVFGSAVSLYKEVYGIDILDMPELKLE